MEVPQGLLLHGPPDGDCRAAQIRWCGAAVDCSAAVAAGSNGSNRFQTCTRPKWPKWPTHPFLTYLVHCYSFGCITRGSVGPFLAIFAIFGGFFGIFWGTPVTFLAIFDGAVTAAGKSTAAPHQRICAARQTPSDGPWSKRP